MAPLLESPMHHMSQTWGNGLPIGRLIICRGPALVAVPLTSVACCKAKTKRFPKSVGPVESLKRGVKTACVSRAMESNRTPKSIRVEPRGGAGVGGGGPMAYLRSGQTWQVG